MHWIPFFLMPFPCLSSQVSFSPLSRMLGFLQIRQCMVFFPSLCFPCRESNSGAFLFLSALKNMPPVFLFCLSFQQYQGPPFFSLQLSMLRPQPKNLSFFPGFILFLFGNFSTCHAFSLSLVAYPLGFFSKSRARAAAFLF